MVSEIIPHNWVVFHPEKYPKQPGCFHSSSTYIASFPSWAPSLISSWLSERPFLGLMHYTLLEDSNLRCFIFPSKMSLPQIIITQILQSSNHFLIKICFANLQIVLSNQKQHSRNFHSWESRPNSRLNPHFFPGAPVQLKHLWGTCKKQGRGGQNGGNFRCFFLQIRVSIDS